MTKRQAIAKAQQLADDEDRAFVVMAGDRRSYVYPLSDLEFPFAAGERVFMVSPRGSHSTQPADEIGAQAARR